MQEELLRYIGGDNILAPLKKGQESAFRALIVFADTNINEARYFVLRGDAGTGKTTLIGRFGDAATNVLGFKVFMTATTNKATKVLRSKVAQECATIHSLMKLRISDDEEQPRLLPPDIDDIDESLRNSIIVIDEASMINVELLEQILEFSRRYQVKIIFVGDKEQLDPIEKAEDIALVGDEGSLVWKLAEHDPDITRTAHLNEIIRYDGPIEILAAQVRAQIGMASDDFRIDQNINKETRQGVYCKGRDFDQTIGIAARNNAFMTEGKCVALAFTNYRVDSLNRQIRGAMLGDAALNAYNPGERIVMTAPYFKGRGKFKDIVARNRDEYVIKEVEETTLTFFIGQDEVVYDVFLLTCTDDTILPVIHPNSVATYKAKLNELAEIAKGRRGWQQKQAWKDFWSHNGAVAKIEYAYAQTTHCSQGSTYHTVFVDVNNIMSVQKSSIKTRLRSLYVAVTRASDVVILDC